MPNEPHYGLSVVVYDDDGDDGGDGLPDVGMYPIDPTWDTTPSGPRSAEALAGFESGNGGLAEWLAVGLSGSVELTRVSAMELGGNLAIELEDGNRVDGPFLLDFCER